MILPLPSSNYHAVALAGSDISPAIRTDHDSDSGRVMYPDEERDFADQHPPSDSDLDGDTQILATLLKHIPECINAADIELLLQDIRVQPPVVIPARRAQDYAGGNTGRRHATILLLAMRALNSSSSVHCARQAPRGAVVHTKRFPWFISARLSLSN